VVACQENDSLVLTCWHVAPDNSRATNVHAGSPVRMYRAEWVAADDRADLALLRVKVSLPTVALADADPEPGMVLWQWGYPYGGLCKPKAGAMTTEIGRYGVWTPFGG